MGMSILKVNNNVKGWKENHQRRDKVVRTSNNIILHDINCIQNQMMQMIYGTIRPIVLNNINDRRNDKAIRTKSYKLSTER